MGIEFKQKEKKRAKSYALDNEVIEKINQLAKLYNTSRSKVLNAVLLKVLLLRKQLKT